MLKITLRNRSVVLNVMFVYFADSENPAEKEDPSFKLTKVHSASTVISNLSLISASIESDLDNRTKDSESPTQDVTKSSTLRSKSSITSRPVKSEALVSSQVGLTASTPDPARKIVPSRRLSNSQVSQAGDTNKQANPTNSYVTVNGHVRSNKRNPSASSVTDHSRTSSVTEPSDSDVDSYSDIVGKRSWRDPKKHKIVNLNGSGSRQNKKSVPENGNELSGMSSRNSHQRDIVIENPARAERTTFEPLNSVGKSLPNLTNINGNGLADERMPYRIRQPRRTLSESNDPRLPNRSRSIPNGRSSSILRQRESGSSDEDEEEHARTRESKISNNNVRSKHVIIGKDRSNEKHSQVLRVSSVDPPSTGESLRLPGNRTVLTRNKDAKVNHAEQLAAEMQQGRMNGRTQSFQRFRADSQSSQDSIEDESRQSAAEKAAAALMNGDVRPTPQQPLAKKSNPQSFEMSQNTTGNRKLRREHLANLANLQSSSC